MSRFFKEPFRQNSLSILDHFPVTVLVSPRIKGRWHGLLPAIDSSRSACVDSLLSACYY